MAPASNRLFIAATRHHVGKTTCTFPIITGLQKRGQKVGFMKPVSLGPPDLSNGSGAGKWKGDPDVKLLKEYFNLPHEPRHMSPVVVGSGYTRAFIDGKVSQATQDAAVMSAFENVGEGCDTVVIEGTGHTGVGSIIGLNNARVASLLGADCILVANGGLGSAFDELELQRVMMEMHGVKIRGVVLNHVRPEKLNMVQEYFSKLLAEHWGVPLIACVPDYGFLGQPTLADLEDYFCGELLTGHRDRRGHYPLERAHLVVTDLRRFLNLLEADAGQQTRTLYMTHCSRDDIILGFLSHCQRMRASGQTNFEAALMLCGHYKDDFYGAVKEAVSETADYPIMTVPMTTHAALLAVRSMVPKLNSRDKVRTDAAVQHYEPFFDFDPLLTPLK